MVVGVIKTSESRRRFDLFADPVVERCVGDFLHFLSTIVTVFFYKFNIEIYNLRIIYDYERSTIQYYKTIPRGAKDHDYPRAIHMKNINLRILLKIQLRETIYEQ